METVGEKSRLLSRSPAFLLEIPSKFVSPPWQKQVLDMSNPPPIHLLHGAWAGHFLFPDLGLRDLHSTLTVLHPRCTGRSWEICWNFRGPKERERWRSCGACYFSMDWATSSFLSSFLGGAVVVILHLLTGARGLIWPYNDNFLTNFPQSIHFPRLSRLPRIPLSGPASQAAGAPLWSHQCIGSRPALQAVFLGGKLGTFNPWWNVGETRQLYWLNHKICSLLYKFELHNNIIICVCSFIYSCIYAFIYSCIYSFIYSFIYLLIHMFACLFVCLCVCWFVCCCLFMLLLS